MRILYVHNINNIAKTYASELSMLGHTATVYEPELRGADARLLVKLSLLPWRTLSMAAWAVREFRSEHFDLVHIHWASYGVFGILSKTPVVIHCHGDDVRERLSQPFFRQVLTTTLRHATAVLCITPDLLPIVRTVCPGAYFSPAPINTKQFAPDGGQIENPSRPWTVLLFARLSPEKGPEIAINGLISFVQRHSNVRVLLLDWGSLKNIYKQRYSKYFEFVPLVPSDQVQQLILSADVVIGQFALGILSLCELQAMSCAKPVICSFCYDKAYPTPPPLFRATTAEEINEQLETLFQHPEAGVALGQRSREWVIENHDYRTLAYETEKLYRTIIRRN